MATKATPVAPAHQSFWLWVMCLTGVDYFSTLGYQPSIAFEHTGLLAPLATVILVLVTLLGALPVYAHVAGESPHGQGSIAMLERLVRGWTGKGLVLALLGFAATDYVITKTLSAADAAEHLIHNPFLEPWFHKLQQLEFGHSQVVVTMILLLALGVMFLRGFREVIWLAVVIVGTYLLLNSIIVGCGVSYLIQHQDKFDQWYASVQQGKWHFHNPPLKGGDWTTIIIVCLLLFPKLALGLSGFETGVAVMPLVRGKESDDPHRPRGRIINTRKLLLTAALIMSVALLGSAFVTTMLIEPKHLQPGGAAANRALAYLAHGEGQTGHVSPLFGEVFGTMYDLSTVVILWFAGASAMAGLLNLVPQYLPRYGMAPEWAKAIRPLVILFTMISLAVTIIFRADVTRQSSAYATGVLVLISSACVATVIHIWRIAPASWLAHLWRLVRLAAYGFITLVFIYTTIDNIILRYDGLLIGACFIAAIMLTSMISRTFRSTELRFMGFEFVDEHSRFLWDSMKHLEFPVLVPHRPGHRGLASKEQSIRQEHHLSPDIPIVFIEASLGDASEFYQSPLMEVKQEEGRFIIKVTRCASIAHVIAAIGLELSKVGKPPEIHFGWSDESPLTANLGFLLFGEGNIPWMVRELILKAEPNPEHQPRIIIG